MHIGGSMSAGLLQVAIEIHPDGLDLFQGQSNAGSVCQRPPVTDGQLPNGRAAAKPFSSLLHRGQLQWSLSFSGLHIDPAPLLINFSKHCFVKIHPRWGGGTLMVDGILSLSTVGLF